MQTQKIETDLAADTLRRLVLAWTEFEARLDRVPLIEKLNRGLLTLEDYRNFLCALRQQVVDGGCWIARAASNISVAHFPLRSHFLTHSTTEHRDFQMLERDFVSVGGALADIQTAPKNIGSEALSAFMFHRASQPDPFDLLGAMFMIEGLGQRKAGEWGRAIMQQLDLQPDQVSFLLYHSENDDDHLDEFERWIAELVDSPERGDGIVKTARIVGRLYAMQLEEV